LILAILYALIVGIKRLGQNKNFARQWSFSTNHPFKKVKILTALLNFIKRSNDIPQCFKGFFIWVANFNAFSGYIFSTFC